MVKVAVFGREGARRPYTPGRAPTAGILNRRLGLPQVDRGFRVSSRSAAERNRNNLNDFHLKMAKTWSRFLRVVVQIARQRQRRLLEKGPAHGVCGLDSSSPQVMSSELITPAPAVFLIQQTKLVRPGGREMGPCTAWRGPWQLALVLTPGYEPWAHDLPQVSSLSGGREIGPCNG